MAVWNMGLRFLLEVAGAAALAWWGWIVVDSWPHYLLAPGAPLFVMTLWGVFNVPGDRSRSGKAPVRVPGVVRLLLEFAIFGSAFAALSVAWNATAAAVFAGVILLHYAASWRRVVWLLRRR